MSIRPAYQDWCLNGLTYLPLLQLEPEPVAPVPPEPLSLPQTPEAASPAGARAPMAITDRAAAVAIPALVRMEVKPGLLRRPTGLAVGLALKKQRSPEGVCPELACSPAPKLEGSGLGVYRV